jgi:hypothetical protein
MRRRSRYVIVSAMNDDGGRVRFEEAPTIRKLLVRGVVQQPPQKLSY